MRVSSFNATDSAIENNLKIRVVLLQLIYYVVVQRGNFAVLFGVQAGQPGLAGMNNECATTTIYQCSNKRFEIFVAVSVINAYATFDGDRNVDC